MIRQSAIIFGCLAVGEIIVSVTGFKLPSSIIGMLLLTLLLKLGWVKPAWVKGISEFFIKTLPFYFVPAGVAVMLYFDIITSSFLPIITSILASTVVVLAATGWTYQILRKRQSSKSRNARV